MCRLAPTFYPASVAAREAVCGEMTERDFEKIVILTDSGNPLLQSSGIPQPGLRANERPRPDACAPPSYCD
jgi:hypothetical protein